MDGLSEFEGRYGFQKPDIHNQNVVLTCRSGRRVLVAEILRHLFGLRVSHACYENLQP